MRTDRLKRRIAATTYRALYWGREHVPPGVRSVIGLLFMVGGVFGFLPVLGFWMLPLGVAFVGLDLPTTRHHIDAWMVRLARQAASLDAPRLLGQPPDQPTSSQ
jgi:hypothetical protein